MTNRTHSPVRNRTCLGIWAVAALTTPLVTGCGGVQWQSRVEPALRRAANFNQLVLVQFYSWTDATCIEADGTVFVNNDVIQALRDFQCVRLDHVLNMQRADQWGVTVVPTYVILRPDGTIIDRRAGQLDPDEFRAFLKWSILRR